MRKINYSGVLVLLTISLSSVWLLCGCETGDGTAALTVAPSQVSLSGLTNTVTFSVGGTTGASNTTVTTSGGLRDLSLPLEWRVTNPALGTILESSGRIAVYARYAENGINTVIVKDQYDAEGFATIHQH